MAFDLIENIRRHGFKRLLLAVSGGLDSICLAHYFIENRETLGIEWLGIAHVHHELREETADRDAAFVEAFAKAHGIPFFLKRLDGEALKAAEGSLEENARDARYKALVEIANIKAQSEATSKCHRHDLTPHTCIVTAHHAGDQAETMYMRLRRGTTLAGLRGIQEVRAMSCEQSAVSHENSAISSQQSADINEKKEIPACAGMTCCVQDDTTETLFNCSSTLSTVYCLLPTISIYRPFLNVTRAELLEYAREHNLKWCEDESNSDVKFARNSIRHQMLPHLEKEVPGATKQLCRIAALADKAYEKVIKKCEDVFGECMDPRLREDDDSLVSRLSSFISIDKKKLNKILQAHKDADLSEMFRLWLSEKGFRFPIGFFYASKEPAHVKIPVRTVYRRRSIVKIRNTVWICEFKDALSAAKFVSCEMKEKDYNEST